jgi:hypothetical protein
MSVIVDRHYDMSVIVDRHYDMSVIVDRHYDMSVIVDRHYDMSVIVNRHYLSFLFTTKQIRFFISWRRTVVHLKDSYGIKCERRYYKSVIILLMSFHN